MSPHNRNENALDMTEAFTRKNAKTIRHGQQQVPLPIPETKDKKEVLLLAPWGLFSIFIDGQPESSRGCQPCSRIFLAPTNPNFFYFLTNFGAQFSASTTCTTNIQYTGLKKRLPSCVLQTSYRAISKSSLPSLYLYPSDQALEKQLDAWFVFLVSTELTQHFFSDGGFERFPERRRLEALCYRRHCGPGCRNSASCTVLESHLPPRKTAIVETEKSKG